MATMSHKFVAQDQLVIAVANGSGSLRELLITEFERQLKWGFTMVAAYESGRKESFDCIQVWLKETGHVKINVLM